MNYTYEKSYSQLDTELVCLKNTLYGDAFRVDSESDGIICFTFGMNIVKIKNVTNLLRKLLKSLNIH